MNYTGNEDCLFINVHTPKMPCVRKNNVLPVMVWIHGGGFTFGSGNDDEFGPDYLIEYDVIIVTFNYRLGVLGFLSLGNSDVPGNAALKDQNLALKWVHDNIKNFGGNKYQITIFGESAGSASVHYQTLSPLSLGLFQNVIMQSGCSISNWAFQENPIQAAFNLGKVLGFMDINVGNLVSFLREQSSEILILNQRKKFDPEIGEETSFLPCKEIPGTGKNFLIEDPETVLKSQQFADVSYIIGITDKEGILMLPEIVGEPEKLIKVTGDENLKKNIPRSLCNGCDKMDSIVADVKKFYFNDSKITWENISLYVDLATDVLFTAGVKRTIDYLSVKTSVSVYVYLFTFEGKLGDTKSHISKLIDNLPKGAAHADDLGYLFHRIIIDDLTISKKSHEVKTIKRICTLWTNFAKLSDPNEENFGVIWKKYNSKSPQYLDIGYTLKTVDSDLLPNRTEFWNNAYSLYVKSNE
ncbi:juvenile hormone esterase-like [Lycorma delicatula]|uniref:juvenile hormone esterase-like n=1 Tax=Lycorma delicatula TaxID=130591 RepID=UPI003F519939